MPKIGIKDKNLILIDTRPFAISDPIVIPLEQIKELIKSHDNRKFTGYPHAPTNFAATIPGRKEANAPT